ncbi:interleukin-17F-like [Pelodytes ibericus]
MTQLKKMLLWQVLTLVALIADSTQVNKKSSSGKKSKCRKENGDCKNCVLVRLDHRPSDNSMAPPLISGLEYRSIVPWTYDVSVTDQRLPLRLFNVTCSSRCVGFENTLNPAPIQREILVLQKKGNIYTLERTRVTVGCTCVYPRVTDRTHQTAT